MASKKPAKTTSAALLSNATGYVAFLDILGFQELLEKPNHAKIIEDVVEALQKRVEYDAKHWTTLRYIAISDSIIITADKGKGWGLVRKIAQVQNALLKQGFAVRGAIPYGPILTYEGTMGRNIFGKTYLHAYKSEGVLAIYPRVVLVNEEIADLIWEDIEGETDRRVSTYIARDKADGIWFVNQFCSQVIGRNSQTARNRQTAEEDRVEFEKRIKQALKDTEAEPRSHMKWRWLSKQLNERLPATE